MPLYQETFILKNNSEYTLVFDKNGSTGLGDGKWPEKIFPNSSVTFLQTGHFQINVTALYVINTPTPQDVYLHFYLYAFGVGHVNMFMRFSSGQQVPNSWIQETNSNGVVRNDHFIDGTVSIERTGLTTQVGSAEFTIG